MKKIIIYLSLLLIFFSVNTIKAEDKSSVFLTPRVAALGGTAVSIADDEGAVLYNPAGLAGLQQSKFVFLNPLIKLGEDYSKILDLKSDLDAATTDAQRAAVMKKAIPLDVPIGLNLYPMYLNPKFGILLFAGGNVRVKLLNPVTPRLEVNGSYDITLMGTYPYQVTDSLTVGASIKIINRNKFFDKRTGNDVVTLYASDMASTSGSAIQDNYVDTKKATGLGFDIGAKYKLTPDLTLAAVIYDFGGTSLDYSGSKSTIKQSLALGASYKLNTYKDMIKADDLTLGMDINNFDESSLVKKLHFGVEGKFFHKLSVRLGLNQGYATFGFGFRLGILQLDYAMYQEELGDSAGDQVDKSQLIGLTLRF